MGTVTPEPSYGGLRLQIFHGGRVSAGTFTLHCGRCQAKSREIRRRQHVLLMITLVEAPPRPAILQCLRVVGVVVGEALTDVLRLADIIPARGFALKDIEEIYK
jgi:hypothetical protein